jgi:UDP-4-amino-4,6-dideoxy-N-acetyl-beta-L-altrosamine N-acetyltransferase
LIVRLRKLTESDSDRVLAWRNSPEVAAFMYSDHLISPAEHERWLTSALTAPDRAFWIIELEGAAAGLANLARIDLINSRCEWAYYLATPAARGRGLGSCVEYLVLRHVFETLKLNKLWCEVFVDNEAVWRLHERFGFQQEALYRDHVKKAGVFRDVIGLGMLARDWPTAKTAAEARLRHKGYEVGALVLEAG